MTNVYRATLRPTLTGRTPEHVPMFGNPLLRVCPTCDAPKYVRCFDVRRGRYLAAPKTYEGCQWIYVRDTSHAER